MHDPHTLHNRILGVLYTTMGIAMSAGVDHAVLAGLYLILGLTCWVSSKK